MSFKKIAPLPSKNHGKHLPPLPQPKPRKHAPKPLPKPVHGDKH
ncbi:hypothetical protein NX794_20990 [Streptomyces sp. LP11]|uniref:Uncharacterized protein n=1 Tax=Streptomyces pyxinicus TaxID=2970331 RepID=A0ABT2B570_9ACTN|nr:hypothetical protein [Streptomyces sp. LP11]MCS0603671.1 hypothetical protein [Streptomyces sp. LP11]